ncbi:thiamine phosphate synthase [Lujinxingia litoralis]|uniref:Thiamine phosphate synthase n=1 Tax=Lujinxingia litoralis TaxID=2211119 RepID=A0A328C1D4_9DELT|nr:thiamine phosphate synthase [Lujinxingia litoralis]RAL20223.1 thiamine phosphate synthase [Lujinxingia litoralis]
MDGGELSRLYLIADAGFCVARGRSLRSVVHAAVGAGVRRVSLRVKGDWSPQRSEALWADAARAAEVAQAAGAQVLVHAEVARGRALHVSGVHLGAAQVAWVQEARQRLEGEGLVGVSCHNQREAQRAQQRGADFVTLSPVFESVSKPGYGGRLTLEHWGELARGLSVPAYALGGVGPREVRACLDAGFYGVAVVGGICGAADVAQAARRYLEALCSEGDAGGSGRLPRV